MRRLDQLTVSGFPIQASNKHLSASAAWSANRPQEHLHEVLLNAKRMEARSGRASEDKTLLWIFERRHCAAAFAGGKHDGGPLGVVLRMLGF